MMPIIVARGIGRVGISIFWHPRELLLLINSYLRREWLPMAMLSVGSKVTADQNNGLLHAFPPPPRQPPSRLVGVAYPSPQKMRNPDDRRGHGVHRRQRADAFVH